MPALDRILNALAGKGWGMTQGSAAATTWERKTAHVEQTLEVYWTAHMPPRLHHAWFTTTTPGHGVSDARFDDVAALTSYIESEA